MTPAELNVLLDIKLELSRIADAVETLAKPPCDMCTGKGVTRVYAEIEVVITPCKDCKGTGRLQAVP